MYITEFAISGLDPAKHAYELEKFLRIAFSHDAVAGISFGDLWDRSAGQVAASGARTPATSGLYAANKQAKPAAARLDHLWKEEWSTTVERTLSAEVTPHTAYTPPAWPPRPAYYSARRADDAPHTMHAGRRLRLLSRCRPARARGLGHLVCTSCAPRVRLMFEPRASSDGHTDGSLSLSMLLCKPHLCMSGGWQGTAEFDGFYGKYEYHLTSEEGKACTGVIELLPRPDDDMAPKGEWGARGAAAEAQVFVVKCDWEGHVHVPVWTTPAALALLFVLCLWGCYRQRAKLHSRKGKGHQRLPMNGSA